MTVSIYSPDATAALITHHAKLFVDDGVRTLLITMNGRRDILEAVICALEDESPMKVSDAAFAAG